jgi:hypothetical protein
MTEDLHGQTILHTIFQKKNVGSIKTWIKIQKTVLLSSALSILLLSPQPLPPRVISLLFSGASGDDAGN